MLNIWEGRDSGPYMHALHFTFGLGAFLGPVVARPFLFTEDLDQSTNTTDLNKTDEINFFSDSTWTIKALYPLVGIYGLLSSVGFLVYYIIDTRKAKMNNESQNNERNENVDEAETSSQTKWKIILVSIMSIMFFIYVGMEVAFGTFVSVFAVESDLHFTRPQGRNMKNDLF